METVPQRPGDPRFASKGFLRLPHGPGRDEHQMLPETSHGRDRQRGSREAPKSQVLGTWCVQGLGLCLEAVCLCLQLQSRRRGLVPRRWGHPRWRPVSPRGTRMRWGGIGVSSRWCFLANGTRGVGGGIRDESQESRCEQGTPVIGGKGDTDRGRKQLATLRPGLPALQKNNQILGVSRLKETENEKSGTFRVAWKKGQGECFWDGIGQILYGAETCPVPAFCGVTHVLGR